MRYSLLHVIAGEGCSMCDQGDSKVARHITFLFSLSTHNSSTQETIFLCLQQYFLIIMSLKIPFAFALNAEWFPREQCKKKTSVFCKAEMCAEKL